MGRLVHLLGIEHGTNTEGEATVDASVVRESCNTTVVDLALFHGDRLAINQFIAIPRSTHLCERKRVNDIFRSNLHADSTAALGIPCSLGTNLNLAVDPVVVGSSEDTEVVGGSHCDVVPGVLVTNGGGVPSDGSLLDVVTGLTTNHEPIVTNDGINGSGRALEKIGKGTEVERWLLEVEVELGGGGVGVGLEAGDTLGLEALRDVAVELNLGVENVCGGPAQGASRTWLMISYQQVCYRGRIV